MYSDALHFPNEESDFESIMAAIHAVRARRAEMNVPPSKKPALTIVTDKPDVFKAGVAYLGRLAYASDVFIVNESPGDTSELVTVVTNDARMYIPLTGLVDIEKERERINKELIKVREDIERIKLKLQNEQFTSKAPEHVINAERDKLQKSHALLNKLIDSLGY
jgi:valyl-tRNA synthetase